MSQSLTLDMLAVQQAQATQSLRLVEDELQNTSKFATPYQELKIKKQQLNDLLDMYASQTMELYCSMLPSGRD